MKTFNNNKELKEGLLKELKSHQLADRFAQGSWLRGDQVGELYKGCFYGCTMQTEEFPVEAFSETYSIDLWYCHLTEKIFEGLPKGEFESFPFESIEILPVGIDLNQIKSKFYTKLLTDQLRFCEGDKKVAAAVNRCIELFKVPFNQIDEAAAEAAAEAAWAAAEAAAKAAAWAAAKAAWAAAGAAAEAAAKAAAWAAAKAAWAAAEAAAEAAAWAAAEAAAKAAAEAAAWAAAEAAAWVAAEADYYVKIKGFLFDAIKESV